MKIFYSWLIGIGLWGNGIGAAPSKLFETHTALLGESREYTFEMNLYDNGGLQTRTSLSITSHFALGLSAIVDGVIGTSDMLFYTPGVFAKAKLTDNPLESWNIAMGYDLIYSGTFYEHNNRYYGLFGVFSKGFLWASPSAHVWSIGVYYPVVPSQQIPRLAVSFFSPLSEMFHLSTEITSISFEEKRLYHFVNNWMITINLSEKIGLHFIMQVANLNVPVPEKNKNADDTYQISRNIRLTYKDYFLEIEK